MKKFNRSGFSLIELMITLTVISVIMAAVVPNYSKRIQSGQLSIGSSGSTKITIKCEQFDNADNQGGKCLACTSKSCIVCTNLTCSPNIQYLDNTKCKCINVNASSEEGGYGQECVEGDNNGCIRCESGYYPNPNNNNICEACPSGQGYNCEGGILACNNGYYIDGLSCKQCESGYYCTALNGKQICPKGKYCQAGASEPTNCPDNTYRDKEGGKTNSDCTACDDTRYCPAGSENNSTLCSSVASFGSASCSKCNSSRCTYCNPGSYKSTDIKCSTCPDTSYYCVGGTSDKAKCSSNTTFTSSCLNCTTTACTNCSANTYLTNGKCQACGTERYCRTRPYQKICKRA